MMRTPGWWIAIGATVILATFPYAAAAQDAGRASGAGGEREAATHESNAVGIGRRDGAGAAVRLPDARYTLRRGDVLELDFPLVPSFNQTITVQPDGYVTLRVVGDLQVDGQTIPALTSTLRTVYASVLRDPVVTVALKEFDKPYFVVAGEVERPGKFDLRGDITVTEALAIAGGLKDRAKDSEAAVFRRRPDGQFEVIPLNLKRILRDRRLEGDVHLASGDMLFVPKGRTLNLNALTSSLWIVPYLLDRY